MTNQRSEPSIAPRRSAGIRPARTTDDFPEPDGPTTARNRDASSSCSSRPRSRFVTASRPKKSPASASRKARSPLYGFRISRTGSSGGRAFEHRPEGQRELEQDRRTGRRPTLAVALAMTSSTPTGSVGPCLTHGREGIAEVLVEQRRQ